MKIIYKLTIILLLTSAFYNIKAQAKSISDGMFSNLQKQKSVKGKKNTYIIKIYDDFCFINNKIEFFKDINPNYSLSNNDELPIPTFVDNEWDKFKLLTDSLIGEYVAKTPKTWNYVDDIIFWLTCDMQGSIKDVIFNFPKQITIPIEQIEKLEEYLKQKMKLHFIINHTNKNANYMTTQYGVELEPMRKAK